MQDEVEETPEERRARWKSITIGGRAPGNKPTDPNARRPVQQPVWEKGKIYEERPGGGRVPLVHAHSPSQPITVKQYQNRRGLYDQQRDRLRNDPNVFQSERNS